MELVAVGFDDHPSSRVSKIDLETLDDRVKLEAGDVGISEQPTHQHLEFAIGCVDSSGPVGEGSAQRAKPESTAHREAIERGHRRQWCDQARHRCGRQGRFHRVGFDRAEVGEGSQRIGAANTCPNADLTGVERSWAVNLDAGSAAGTVGARHDGIDH